LEVVAKAIYLLNFYSGPSMCYWFSWVWLRLRSSVFNGWLQLRLLFVFTY